MSSRFTRRDTLKLIANMGVATFAGSAMWEIAGEDTLPSRNDQVASGIAGSFLGEALFRMSSLVLELLTTLSVATVAVSIGVRLLHGTLDLTTGLWVLLQMLELLEHYDLAELRRLVDAAWDSPDPQSG